MTFASPAMLLVAVVAVPLLVLGYRHALGLRSARRERLAALGLVAPASVTSGRRRHVPAVLLLLALTVLLVGLARPQATVAEPRREGTVVLAFDVSGSMAATDIEPNRLAAAKAAARRFVRSQPRTIRIGLVAFGENGLITQQPTKDRTEVLAAIKRLTPRGGTSLGRGIQTSLSAIVGRTVQLDRRDDSLEAKGPDLGYHRSSAVILLTDGENTAAPDPLDVADVSSTAGVRIFPIGLGSPDGTVLKIDGFQVSTKLDEPLLREIAAKTDGKYYTAQTAKALTRIYQSIPLSFTIRAEQTEITWLFALAAAALMLLACGLSFTWFGRVI